MKAGRKRIIFYLISAAVLAGIVGFGAYMKQVCDYQKAVKNITFESIKLSDIPNGTYTGMCDVDFISAKVEVTVKNGSIASIDILEHKNGRGAAAEQIVDTMVKEQRIDVDAISGATNSSAVIKKAVENALIR